MDHLKLKKHTIYFSQLNGWTETDAVNQETKLPSGQNTVPPYNKAYNCGLIRRNDTKSKILRVSNLALYNLPLSVYNDADRGVKQAIFTTRII